MLKMTYLSTDHLIVYAFLLITLVIGLRAGRGIKDIREYALANRSFGTVALVLTFLATDIAGVSVVNGAAKIFSEGIIYVVAHMGLIINFSIMAFVVAPCMVHFRECMTLGDIMRSIYGTYSGILVGILGFCIIVCLIGMELFILGIISETVLGIKASWGIIFGGVVFSVYAAHGGIKSVTATDIFQFIVLIVGIPLIAYIAADAAGGIQNILTNVPADRLQVFGHEKFSYYLVLFILWSFLPLGISSPIVMQRMLMAQNTAQLRNQFLVIGIFLPLFRWVLLFIGLAALVLYPSIEPNNAVAHLIHELLPVGVKGIAIAALIGISMSSLDSLLHTAGLTIVHDVIKPILDFKRIAINELRWIRWATVLVSIIAISIGLHATDSLKLLLTALSFQAPTVLFPLLAGIMGLKVDKRYFYTALLCTLASFLAAKLYLPATYEHFAILIHVTVNAIVFFGMHLIDHKGFVMVDRSQDTPYLWQPAELGVIASMKRLLPTPQRIVKYSQKQVEKYGAPYILFGVFIAMLYTMPYFLWSYTLLYHRSVMLILRLIGGILCALLIVKDKWSDRLLPYLPTFWHLTLLYCLPFTSTVMFLLTQGSVEWLINITLTIMFLIVLVDWMSFILLTVLGVVLGFLFYQTAIGPIDLHLDFSTGYLLVYQGIFATLIGLLFARRKQLRFDSLVTQRKRLSKDNQEVNDELLSATEESMHFVSLLKKAGLEQLESAAHLSKELLAISQQKGDIKDFTLLAQQLTDQLTPMALSMDRFVHRTTGFLLLDGVEKLPLDTFLQKVQKALQEKDYKLKIAVRTQCKTIQWDVEKMKKVLVNSFSFLRSVAGEDAPVLLGVEDTQLGYPVDSVSPDHVKKVTSLRFSITTASTLPKLAALYLSQMGEESMIKPDAATDLPLLANERIVKAHYGYTSTISEEGELTLLYVIPLNVREVRSKDMDTPQMQLGATWSRADDTYPGAQGQEQAFLQAVKERSKAHLPLVEKAIDVIKDSHGPVKRHSGEPFYLHPISVAQIVLDYNQDEATILGALLHDTVEDTPLTLEQIALLFNKAVSDIVSGVTHMESHQATTYKVLLSHPENIHRLLGAEDQRVLYVKLADRMHNMRTIEAKPYASQRRTAEETLLFFVPLAKYLRLTKAAEELKELSFKVLSKSPH
jgi:Na+/proline symporter